VSLQDHQLLPQQRIFHQQLLARAHEIERQPSEARPGSQQSRKPVEQSLETPLRGFVLRHGRVAMTGAILAVNSK
jgi:hypothetical protein